MRIRGRSFYEDFSGIKPIEVRAPMASTVWKGYLTFGLVSIPVRLYAAARSKSIRFNELYRHSPSAATEASESDFTAAPSANVGPGESMQLTGSSPSGTAAEISRVTHEFHPAGEQRRIERQDLVKGYQYSPGQYVVLEKSEIQRLVPKTSTTMDLFRFIKLSEVDPIFFERSYYVAPESDAEKPYALLFQAMQRSGYCGLANVAMHRREHIVVLRPHDDGILAHTMYYVDEVRDAPDTSTGTVAVTDKELNLAESFIKALAGSFEPDHFRDEYRARIQALIQGKVRAEKGIAPAQTTRQTKPADIMEMLKASLEHLGRQQPETPPRQKPKMMAKPHKRRSA